MKICPKCTFQSDDEAEYCSRCGFHFQNNKMSKDEANDKVPLVMDNWNKKGNEERITAPIVVCILAFGLCWVKYLGLFLSSIALFMIVDARRDKATAKSSNYKVSLIISIIALVISFFVTVLRPLSNEGKAEEVISSSSYEFGEFDDISSSEKESEGKANELTRNKLDVDDSQSPII